MEKEKRKNDRLVIFLLALIVVLMLVIGVGGYYLLVLNKGEEKSKNEVSGQESKSTSNTILNEEKNNEFILDDKQISKLKYRKETRGSTQFYIKNDKIYDEASNSEIKSISETPKYVLPIDKQIGTALVLTEEGNVWTNQTDRNNFTKVLDKKNIIEIIDTTYTGSYCFLTNEKTIIDIYGNKINTKYFDETENEEYINNDEKIKSVYNGISKMEYTDNWKDDENGKIAILNKGKEEFLRNKTEEGYYIYTDAFSNNYRIKVITDIVSKFYLANDDETVMLYKCQIKYITPENTEESFYSAVVVPTNTSIEPIVWAPFENYTATTSFIRTFGIDEGM